MLHSRTPLLPWAKAMNGGRPRIAPVAPVKISVPPPGSMRLAASLPTMKDTPMFISHMYWTKDSSMFRISGPCSARGVRKEAGRWRWPSALTVGGGMFGPWFWQTNFSSPAAHAASKPATISFSMSSISHVACSKPAEAPMESILIASPEPPSASIAASVSSSVACVRPSITTW